MGWSNGQRGTDGRWDSGLFDRPVFPQGGKRLRSGPSSRSCSTGGAGEACYCRSRVGSECPSFAPPGELHKSLVDNINTFWGRLALLEILAYGCSGDYGFDAAEKAWCRPWSQTLRKSVRKGLVPVLEVGVLIPAYNEADRIAGTRQLSGAFPKCVKSWLSMTVLQIRPPSGPRGRGEVLRLPDNCGKAGRTTAPG